MATGINITLSEIESNDWITAKEGAEYTHRILGITNKTDNFIAFAKYHGIRKIKPFPKSRYLYSMDDLEAAISWQVIRHS